MGRDEMRAGDADRQVVADTLAVALGEGRLDLHEYDERLRQAYAAKTYGELNGLLADLPTTVPAGLSQMVPAPAQGPLSAPAPAVAPDATRRWLIATWDDYGAVVGITFAIWLVGGIGTGDFGAFWPIWVAGPWGAILLWHTISGLSSGEPQRWAEKQERKRVAKQARRDRAARRREGVPPGRASGAESAGDPGRMAG